MNIIPGRQERRSGFTLIELLVVIAIISMLVSIMMPSLGRARDQAKGVHCQARLKEFGNAIGSYENIYGDMLPPAEFYPLEDDDSVRYGWCEVLWHYVYGDPVYLPDYTEGESFPVQRNVGDRWEEYFICKASDYKGLNSGNYRVYLPAWSASSYQIESDGTFDDEPNPEAPFTSVARSSIRPRLVLIGDANPMSVRGDGGLDDCSYIGPGEANDAGVGRSGNRFSDRHYGGTNFLFQDLHATWERKLRQELAVDYDLNGIRDVEVLP